MVEELNIVEESVAPELPPLEWWRRPVYILFKLLPLIVLVVLIWNWVTVTREWEAAKRGEDPATPAAIEP